MNDDAAWRMFRDATEVGCAVCQLDDTGQPRVIVSNAAMDAIASHDEVAGWCRDLDTEPRRRERSLPESKRWIEISCAWLGDRAIAVSAVDITARKNAETAQDKLSRKKDSVIATTSHGLRNPVAALRGAGEILAAADGLDREQLAAIEVVNRQAAMMNRFLDDLRDASQMTSTVPHLSKHRVSLASIIAGALDLVAPLIRAAGHEVTVDVRPPGLRMLGDPLRWTRVIASLLTNAAKYTPRGGRLHVSAEVVVDDVVIHVIDSGSGLAASDSVHLFETFAVDDGDVDHPTIGLAHVRAIVELHGGWIRVESAGPGRGSRFVITVPRGIDEKATRPASTRRPSVVLADDNADVLAMFAAVLSARGHEVVTAAGGADALAETARVRPDVVVLDLAMPDIHGLEVARRLRAMPWGAQLRLIALTGRDRVEDARDARDAVFDAYIAKGAVLGKLFAMLDATQPAAR